MKNLIQLVVLALLGIVEIAQAQKEIVYESGATLSIWESCEVFEDKSASLKFEDIIKQYQNKFKTCKDIPSIFGFTSSALWIKFSVKKPKDLKPIFLTVERVSLWEADLYFQDDGKTVERKLGVNIPFDTRPFKSKYVVDELTFSEDQTSTIYYLRLRAITSLFIPVFLDSPESLSAKLSKADFFTGIYLGLFIVLILYNVVSYVFRRQSIYLIYLLYVLALFVYQGLFNTGIGFEYVWPDYPQVNKYYVVSASVLGLTMILFSSYFLSTKDNLPKLHRPLWILVFGFCAFITFSFIGYNFEASKYFVWILLLTFFYLLVLGIISMMRGNVNARWYTAGWGVLIIFYFAFTLWLNGFIGDSFIGHRALFIGSSLEMIFWFSAISDKISHTRQAQVAEEKRIRKEIARDFHDELGNQAARLINMISLLKLKGLIQKENYEQLSIFAQNILDGAKDFVWALDPKNDELYNAVIHLKDFGERLFSEKEITFRYFGEIKEGISLPTGFSRQINLIFKEAMTNAFKYSNAKDVDFRAERHKREVFIILTDNGKGVAKETISNSRSGFENMRYRANKIGGEIEFQSSSYGTTVQLRLKLTPQ